MVRETIRDLVALDALVGGARTADRALAASTAAGPRQDLVDATEHLAALAVALRELAPRT
ncbi:hypothetical protein GCM10023148_25520 [Actinokineospora soli]